MLSFHEKRKLRQLMYSKVALIALAIIVLFLANSVWGVYQKERETRKERARQEQQLAELKERERALREEIERLNTERGVEAELRQKFEVAREGEKVLVIVDPKKEDGTADQEEKRSLWRRFLDIF